MNRLNFIVTDKCNIKCDFCAVGSGPNLEGNLSFNEMCSIYDQLHKLSKIDSVVFTGGEPFIYLDEIYNTLDFIYKKNQRPVVRIITNAYWATSFNLAKEILSKLKKVGLTELNYSVDDFHQQFIPVERIKNAVEAALDLNIPVHLAHKTYPGSISNKSTYEELLNREILDLGMSTNNNFSSDLLTFSSGNTVPIGRGSDKINKSEWVPKEFSKNHCKGPCSSVFDSINISPKGFLVPCCGLIDREIPLFYSGNILENNLEDIMKKSNKNILYNWLALEGPYAIKEFVNKINPEIYFEGKYVQKCQICQELFSNDEVISIISENLDIIGTRVGLQRSMFDAIRDIELLKISNSSI